MTLAKNAGHLRPQDEMIFGNIYVPGGEKIRDSEEPLIVTRESGIEKAWLQEADGRIPVFKIQGRDWF